MYLDHIASSLLQIVDTAMILSNGKIIAQDTPSNLIKDIDAKMHTLVIILKLN